MTNTESIFIIAVIKRYLSYHITQASVVCKEQNMLVSVTITFCVSLCKFAFSYACKTCYKNAVMFVKEFAEFLQLIITTAEISA